MIRLATFEVEARQKRLTEIAIRRADAQTRLRVLEAEGEAESKRAAQDAEAGWYLAGYKEGLKIRKAAAMAEIDALEAEERGARDALAEAFEDQKKYEHVAEASKKAKEKEANRRETAELDELGLRRIAR